MNYDPSLFYQAQLKDASREMAVTDKTDLSAWRPFAREKLLSVLKMPEQKGDMKPVIVWEKNEANYRNIHFNLETEPGLDMPCHLLIPSVGEGPFPVMVCLQGHSTGMQVSLGEDRWEGDAQLIAEGEDYAIAAVHHGFAALVLEQRNFGLREALSSGLPGGRCLQPTMQSFLLGRTMVGDRVYDISRAIDALAHFSEIDGEKIAIIGQSGGGTAAFFTACTDARIKLATVSGYFCPLGDSIFSLYHCQCNYIPGILKYFDLDDLTALIAPQPLVIVTGRDDPIFPAKPAQRAFEKTKMIYAMAGAPDNCVQVIGEGEHRFFPDLAWPKIVGYAKEMGWGVK